jgi:hypothetical protein
LSKLLSLSYPLSSSGIELIEKKGDDGEANMATEMVTDVGQLISNQKKSKEEFLPCWKWLDDSCSLDASLLLSLRVHQELHAKCQSLSSDAVEPVYESWRKSIQDWQSKGAWENYNGASMHDKRNSIRELLKDGGLKDGKSITISKNTTDSALMSIFIPPSLSTFHIKTHFKCTAPVHLQNPGLESQASKTRSLKQVSVQGIWAKDSGTQEMLHKSVLPKMPIIV